MPGTVGGGGGGVGVGGAGTRMPTQTVCPKRTPFELAICQKPW
ncbi:MAG: hypothetical protein BWY52_03341 [Chloroflexi bacterium ADurb.Bin325]|nr:MAG: hypothetical protein BWY52_03341 [Chloroflexi bacterium ADurb.Bin325]